MRIWKRSRKQTSVFFVVVLAWFTLLGCGLIGTAVQPTATPSSTPAPTETPRPSPTATFTSTPTPTVTNTPTATLDRTATAAVMATQVMEQHLAEVMPALKKVGMEDPSGRLAFFQKKPIRLTVDSAYMVYNPRFLDNENYADFVLQSDVTWDSTSGLAGCGVIFRADDDLDDGAKYEFDIMRLSGAPLWYLGYIKYNQEQNPLGNGFASAIKFESNSTNRIVLKIQKSNMQFYVNGDRIHNIDYGKLTEGRIALIAWQESGKTSCVFENTWIWVLE